MQLLPAIDIRGGRVVRLRRGDDRQRTTYELSPLEAIAHYVEAGVERVHVVDLDAALGEAPQRSTVEDLLGSLASKKSETRVQLGGGLRDRAAVEWAFAAGCDRVVITSLIVRDFAEFASLCHQYERRVVAALDIEEGELKTAGWTVSAGVSLDILCQRLRALPLAAVLVTDISRDGTLAGPNLELACELGRACGAPALLSGGVKALDDLISARERPEIEGAIVGKALYDGAIELDQALAACRDGAGEHP